MGQVKTIAVVDDDRNDLMLVDLALSNAGFHTLKYSLGSPLLRELSSRRVHGAVIDVRLPDISGLDIIAEISRTSPDIRCVMASGHSDIPIAVRAMKLGAVDFIEKPVQPERLVDIVKRAVENRAERGPVGASLAEKAHGLMDQLTPREREVLGLLLQGYQNKMIAYEIGISQRTVEVHRARLMKRLNVKTFAELVRTAVEGQFSNAGERPHPRAGHRAGSAANTA